MVVRTQEETCLLDCGSSSRKTVGETVLIPFLKSSGIGRIDTVVVTHGDEDHLSGIVELLQSGDPPVDRLVLPFSAADSDTGGYGKLREAAGAQTEIVYLGAGDTAGPFSCLSPDRSVPPSDSNGESLVLLYALDNFRALFPGDADQTTERRILSRYGEELSDLTVLKCGHHGSHSSSSEELLQQARPRLAVLSYGEGNRYGHPHAETEQLLSRYADRRCDTARCGAIILETDGTRLFVRTWLPAEE